ncbi:restriction modification system DNA specificity subunit [Brochothrix thermosphacta DSM 20171 = FSL F6-1036]|nr:restriction modification system DNA specificity subunit [Brochothrix thermosphacta DSM 20171 = FSL F6-1036]
MEHKNIPEIRFSGFTNEWEQRRLSEVLRERNNQQPQSMEYPLVSFTVENGVTPKTDRYEREQLVVGDKSSKKYKVTVLNDIVYNPANLKFGAISRNKYGNAVFSPIYVTFLVNNDVTMPEFIEMLITRKDFIKRALKYQQGTVYERQSVSPENLLSMNLYLPGKLEQEKIGTFFKHLDDTISLQQCKLDLLKEQKKGYLQKMFPKNGQTAPEIRFKGFTDDWEERKLGELASFSKGNGYTKNDLVEFGDPIILYGRLYTKYETVIEKVDTFVNKKDKSIISEGSEVIVPASGESSEDISRASVVGKSGIILGGDLNIIKPVNYIDSIFLALTISNGSQQKEMSKRAQGKSVVHLHNSDLKQVNILYPKLEEQQKIGSFFKQLDNTIALHQRKLELLKEQKKRLFTKNVS